jgi:hypothetical protein
LFNSTLDALPVALTEGRLNAIEQCFTVGDIRDHNMDNFIRDDKGQQYPYSERVKLQGDHLKKIGCKENN